MLCISMKCLTVDVLLTSDIHCSPACTSLLSLLQSVYCFSMPHIVHFAVGVIALIVFVVLGGFFIMGEMEVRAS